MNGDYRSPSKIRPNRFGVKVYAIFPPARRTLRDVNPDSEETGDELNAPPIIMKCKNCAKVFFSGLVKQEQIIHLFN